MRPILILLWTLCVFAPHLFADSKLKPIGGTGRHHFGDSVSISGQFAAVSAHGSDYAFDRSGGVHLFKYVTSSKGKPWKRVKTITPVDSEGYSGTYFGQRVQLAGNHLAVTSLNKVHLFHRNAPGRDQWGRVQVIEMRAIYSHLSGDRLMITDPNLTWVYEWNSDSQMWTQMTSFANHGPEASLYGALALHGNTAVIGNPSGGATVLQIFERNSAGEWIGGALVEIPVMSVSVALKGNWLAIGVPAESNHEGRVHVYSRNRGGRNKWGLVQTLTAKGTSFGFGTKIGISGTRIAVGMEGPDQAVHVFERSGSKFRLKGRFLKGRFKFGTEPSVAFGRELAIDGNRLLVSDIWPGFPDTDYSGVVSYFNIGAARPSTITLEKQLLHSEDESGADDFGASIAMDGDTVIVGSPGADDTGADRGAITAFVRLPDGIYLLKYKMMPIVSGDHREFGRHVAQHGNTLVVSGIYRTRLYERSSPEQDDWDLVKEFDTGFIQDISFHGDTLAVAEQNRTHVFVRNAGGDNAWGGMTIEVASNRVCVFGDVLTISGSIYTRSGPGALDWTFLKSVPGSGIDFDSSLSGDTFAFGTEEMTPQGLRPVVVLYKQHHGGPNAWGELARIPDPSAGNNSGFGRAIHLSNSTLTIGAPFEAVDGVRTGKVYVFRSSGDQTSWQMTNEIHPSDLKMNDGFGTSVVSNGIDVAGGAPRHSAEWPSSGAVFVSRVPLLTSP